MVEARHRKSVAALVTCRGDAPGNALQTLDHQRLVELSRRPIDAC